MLDAEKYCCKVFHFAAPGSIPGLVFDILSAAKVGNVASSVQS